jgi:ubiquinone/menaquinone biosynthesis C-methylase UbiE
MVYWMYNDSMTYPVRYIFSIFFLAMLPVFAMAGFNSEQAQMTALLTSNEQNVNPTINRHYQNPDFEHWVGIFERPGREVYDQRHAIVKALALQPGMVIADVGAGTGLFTRLFAREVGESGLVYAVDISKNFVKNILRTAREQDLDNIKGIVNDQKSVHLPAASVDMVFISDTYHHFEYPITTMDSIYQALRPNGQLIIIDFHKQKGISSDWVMSHVRSNRENVIHEIESAGFRLSREFDFLETNYFIKFIKIKRN